MNFKEFLIDIDNFLASEQFFASYYYSYVNNAFTERKLKYPLLVYHVDGFNHSILENSITNLKFNFFAFDKLKSDNSNVIEVQDDLLKRLIYLQFYLKRVHYATNFTLTAVSDEAYSEKITGWIMNCEVKLDTSDESCGLVMYPRYLEDGICRYDRFEHKIVECLLPDGTEIEFPDYTYFLGNEMFPVYEIEPLIFYNIKFTGDFKMNNMNFIGDYEFQNDIFTGDFEGGKIEHVGYYAFYNSEFVGELNLQNCKIIGFRAFYNSKFTGELKLQNCKFLGNGAFYNSKFVGELNLQNCKIVDDYTFRYSNFSGSLNLPMCTYIGRYALQNSNFSGSLSLPVCEQIRERAFVNSNFSGELSLPVCEQIGERAFRVSNFSGSLNLPVCIQIGESAFHDSIFTEITIGANATLGTSCIGAHSAEFINDYAANGKLAGTYVWNGQHWIYQN